MNGSSLSEILEMTNLTEIIFSQPLVSDFWKSNIEEISSKLKIHKNQLQESFKDIFVNKKN